MFLYIYIVVFLVIDKTYGHFGYSKRHQHTWAQKYKLCAGEMQSPIALSSAKAVALPLPSIERIGYHDLLSGLIKLKNNGHSVSLSVNKEVAKRRLPYVFGALLNKNQEYELESLHFHWGFKNNRGSEHILNGIRFPMEMHVIHRNMMYSNINEAMQHEDGLAVLGVFFQLQEEDNENLNPILQSLPYLRWNFTEVLMDVSITLASLMPRETDIFYTYRGSLTTPPCSEAVTWIIFSSQVPISFRQMNKFRILSNGEDILADNYRYLQEIGNRKVYVRRLESSFARRRDMIDLDIATLSWFWR